jgi:hypothetical protein
MRWLLVLMFLFLAINAPLHLYYGCFGKPPWILNVVTLGLCPKRRRKEVQTYMLVSGVLGCLVATVWAIVAVALRIL